MDPVHGVKDGRGVWGGGGKEVGGVGRGGRREDK